MLAMVEMGPVQNGFVPHFGELTLLNSLLFLQQGFELGGFEKLLDALLMTLVGLER